jgi:YfiH family protein
VFAHQERIADRSGQAAARIAVTDRFGGVSTGPYGELNLGGTLGDDPVAVETNRARVAAALGLERDQLVFMHQVHGRDVAVVDGPWRGEPPAVDAMVTRQRGIALAVLVADCTPVLLVDPHEGVVGVAHAGRAGLAAGVVTAVVDAMRDLGATALIGRVGPSICGRCYEVPMELREQVATTVPETRSMTWHGTSSLDIAAGVMAQLAPHCVELDWLPGCSRERDDLFSYRRAPRSGRFAGLAWLEP